MSLAHLSDGASLVSLLGDKLYFSVNRRGVSINGAYVSVADIQASNGVVHIIDRVLVHEGDRGFGTEKKRITDVLNSPEFSTFRNLLREGRLYDILDHGGPFTLFAPTERAFELVSPIFLRRMKNDQNYLRSVLLQHIVLGEVRFPSLLRSDIARTLNGKLLWLTSSSGGYQVNGTMVLQKDIKVSNGVVHVLHNMLMPPDGERITYPIIEKNHHFRNVIDTISANGLKAFERLIDHVALRAILVLDGPFTIFAPTDTAFNSLDPRLIGTLTSDKDLLKDIILQHVVRGRVRENELALGWEGFALNGQNLYSSLLGHDITVSGSRVIIPNIDSQNGIVHVVDRVILPPRAKVFVPLLSQLDEKGIRKFGELLTKSGLSQDYFYPGPFTTFIPTDEAFSSLNPHLLTKLENDHDYLRRVFKYHMIPELMHLENLGGYHTFPTALGDPFQLRISNRPLRVNEAKVFLPGLNGTSGIMYLVDQVLLPPHPIYHRNISRYYGLPPQHDFEGAHIMRNLLDQAGLLSILEADKPYTFFLPSDTALHSMPDETRHRLSQDTNFLRNFLLNHATPGKLSVQDLMTINRLESLTGLPLSINVHNHNPSVNGARIINPGIRTENGVFNIVDKVLLPPSGTVADLITSNRDRTKIPNIWDRYSLLNPLKNSTRPDLSLFSPTSDAFSRNPFLNPPLVGSRGTEDLLHHHLLYGLNRPCYTPKICYKDYLFADGTKTSPPRKREEKGERKAPPPK
ncbi:UNVERIFIED_CONTAM: hypothetical protein RMT77_007261 [Armadillidium vulgare]